MEGEIGHGYKLGALTITGYAYDRIDVAEPVWILIDSSMLVILIVLMCILQNDSANIQSIMLQ